MLSETVGSGECLSRGLLRDVELTPRKVCDIQVRTGYGQKRYYPANKLGEKYAELLGKKTLNRQDLDFLIYLGVKVNQILDI